MTDEAVSIQNEEIGKARRKELIQSGQEKHQTSSPNVLKTQSATGGSAKEPRTDGICQQKLDEIQQPQVEGGIKSPLHGAGTHWIPQPWFWGVNQPPYVRGFQQVVVGGAVQHPPVANLNQHPPVANLTQHPTMANLIQQPQPLLNGIQQQQPPPGFQQPPLGSQQPPPGLNGIQQPGVANGIQQLPVCNEIQKPPAPKEDATVDKFRGEITDWAEEVPSLEKSKEISK